MVSFDKFVPETANFSTSRKHKHGRGNKAATCCQFVAFNPSRYFRLETAQTDVVNSDGFQEVDFCCRFVATSNRFEKSIEDAFRLELEGTIPEFPYGHLRLSRLMSQLEPTWS